jgi:eukaryotic-like serine/threonine-protein kinase
MSTNDKLAPGMVLGRYELLLPIAQGGMATVWAARQKGSRGFQKTVAIKTMLPALTDDPQFEQMFLDEAGLAAKIHHPNVAEILDLGEEQEILYIVMEWVDGEALSTIHKAARKNNTQIPLRIALRIISQATAGLHAAHEMKDENDIALELVHRDVSPQNILVTFDGIVKLVDFGVAKATGRASGETTAGQLKGKVPYMSPEQARGGRIDRRTDIFAMGIVLYKLTTGVHPFLGENDLVTMRNILSRPLLPPRVKNPSFPQELDTILVRCLQKDPDKRYDTMSDLGLAIDRAVASMGIADDDLGGFIRTLMGERGAKRRAALRDAVRAADERGVGAIPPPTASSGGAVVHEGVSEIVLTAMNSGLVKEELLSERASVITSPSSPTSLASTTSPSPASSDAPISPSEMGIRPTRFRLLAAVGATTALVVLAFLLLRSGPGRVAASPIVPPAQKTAAQGATLAPPPPPAEPPLVATPPSAAPTAVAVAVNTPPATAAVTATTSTPVAAITVDSLPTVEPAVAHAPAVVKTTAAAAAPDGGAKATGSKSGWTAPVVTTPGF